MYQRRPEGDTCMKAPSPAYATGRKCIDANMLDPQNLRVARKFASEDSPHNG